MRSSTATGLFQFLEQTWLGTLKQAGPALGYGSYAAAITQTRSGRYEVADPALRQEIMELRKDPAANAVMGGAFTQQNAAVLAQRIGRAPTEGELYIGHFFGPYAGAKAINLAASNPNAECRRDFSGGGAVQPADLLRQGRQRRAASRASAPSSPAAIRWRAPARPRHPWKPASAASAEADRERRVRRRARDAVATIEAGAGRWRPWHVTPASAPAKINDLLFSPAPLPTMLAFASEQPAASESGAQPATRGETFRSLFQSVERREAVSPVVAALWSTPAEDAAKAKPTAGVPRQPALRPPRRSTLDLFRDTAPNVAQPARRRT